MTYVDSVAVHERCMKFDSTGGEVKTATMTGALFVKVATRFGNSCFFLRPPPAREFHDPAGF